MGILFLLMMIQPVGIYLHIPFCIQKCSYCDFYSITHWALKPAFLSALFQEIKMTSERRLYADSVYFGGGTPSALECHEIVQIIQNIHRYYDIAEDAEITIEANPGTITIEKLKIFYESGINRINIGVQSFQNRHLAFLGRIHSSEDAYRAVEWARTAGFHNLGMDLIFGVPGQDPDLWQSDLEQAVALSPEHLSCYMLTYESGTPIETQRQKGLITPLEDEILGELFDMTEIFLAERGYDRYEISNYAKSSQVRSRHNQKYWNYVPYIGLGPSAHSFSESYRWWNCRSVADYIQHIENGQLPIVEKERLTDDQQLIEMIYLGLRTTDGVKLLAFKKRFGVCLTTLLAEPLKYLEENGLIGLTGERCMLTRKGMRFSDSVIAMLIRNL